MAQNLNMFPATDMRLLYVVSCTQTPGGVAVSGSVQCISNLCNALHINIGNETQPCSRGVGGMGEFGVAEGHTKVTSVPDPLCDRIVLADNNEGVV